MAATLTAITPYLKEVYTGRIREQLNQEIIALSRMTKSSAGVTNETGGKYVTFPIHTRRNSGIGSRLENEALPSPGQQGLAAARIGLKYAYGGVQITGQAISLSDTDPKAFARALDVEMEGLKNDLKKDMNRQIYQDGSGTIAVINAVVTAVIIPVNDARLFQIGEVVDIVTTPSTVVASARTVTAVSLAAGANTVTISGANVTTTATGMIITRTGSYNARELTGFGAIVASSGTLYNVDPSTEPEWTSEVNSNSGTNRALSEGLMISLIDRIRIRGGKTSVIFQSLGVRRAYFNLLSQTRQSVNTQEFTGGFKGLAFTTDLGEVPVVADPDAPLNTQWYINEESFTFYRDQEWHWLDTDGDIWKQVRDTNGDYDAFYARLVEYHELGCDTRNSQGKLADVTEA